MNYLFIINNGPYGNSRPYNALRLAMNLVKREGTNVRVFLMGDGVHVPSRDRIFPRAITTSSVCWVRLYAEAKSPPEGPARKPKVSGRKP
jgi:sulfur relay (sulfurtransferase) complex TusBCD TusD component (DsrE family)